MMRHMWFYMGCLATGVLVGVGIPRARSDDAPGKSRNSNPNVVVLRGEKTVTVEDPSLTMAQVAEACAKQTGYTFTLDPQFREQKRQYAVLVRNAPFSHLLVVTGYLANGVWERSGRTYHLRPRTSKEGILDTARYEALTNKVFDYLKDLDSTDASLPEDVRMALAGFRGAFKDEYRDFPLIADNSVNNWSVTSAQNRITITYQESQSTPTSSAGRVRSQFWSWTDPRRFP